MNDLKTLFLAMASGKRAGFYDTKGRGHIGIINGIMREDGSGKNWIITLTQDTVTEKIFIHAK
jgi:hypothetical protein